jgi:putative DNA primase/helicase
MNDEALDPADRITIEGEGHDEWGHRFFKFAVRGSDRNIAPFSAKEILDKPNALFGELTNAGANVFQQAARNNFLRRLDEHQPQSDKFKVVTRLGWNSGAFILPNEIVGQPSTTLEPSFRHLDPQLLAKYRVKGSLTDWQRKIGDLCSGNSRLMFCASLGLAGPILRLVSGPRSGGFQLFGPAESGKTAAAMITGSIWGCHRSPERRENGFSESWHTTAGKVELTALAHNETVLVLDETKRAGRNDRERAQAVLDISFGLAENVERERLTNLGSVRGWRFYFLSTSNYSLDDLARRGDCDIDDAERGRLVDIPNPNGGYGIYEELHGFVDGQKFSDSLKVRCRKFYGAVAQEFLRKLVQGWTTDRAGLKRFLKEERLAYLQVLKAKAVAEKLKPLNRASGRFATVFAAGSLAIKYEIFQWKRDDLLQAILSCQLDGLTRTTTRLGPGPGISLRSKARSGSISPPIS